MSRPGFDCVTPIVCVSDMSVSLRYYHECMGFDIAWTWSEDAAFDEPEQPTFACVVRGNISLFLCENDQGNPGGWMCLNLPDTAALATVYDEYRTAGARIVEPPVDCPWGMREMLVTDPDGNRFRIGCVLNPA